MNNIQLYLIVKMNPLLANILDGITVAVSICHSFSECECMHAELNRVYEKAMADFLEFVDINSQPNGHQAGIYIAQFFLLPNITRIVVPWEGEKKKRREITIIIGLSIQQATNRERKTNLS